MTVGAVSPHASLADEVAARRWYHTLDLPGGIETAGEWDLRPALKRVPLPASLEGMRCLDVGTHDGFWAFEMERRGAAEVVAIDLDDPHRYDWPQPAPILSAEALEALAARHDVFTIAHRALDSRVDRRSLSVYDLDPDEVGRFDFAVIGTLMLHLRDPAGALMAIRRVLDGRLLVNDVVSLSLTFMRPRTAAAKLLEIDDQPFWWMVNVRGQRRLLRDAGYEIVQAGGPYLVGTGAGFQRISLLRGYPGVSRARQLLVRRGAPHAWALAQPRH